MTSRRKRMRGSARLTLYLAFLALALALVPALAARPKQKGGSAVNEPTSTSAPANAPPALKRWLMLAVTRLNVASQHQKASEGKAADSGPETDPDKMMFKHSFLQPMFRQQVESVASFTESAIFGDLLSPTGTQTVEPATSVVVPEPEPTDTAQRPQPTASISAGPPPDSQTRPEPTPIIPAIPTVDIEPTPVTGTIILTSESVEIVPVPTIPVVIPPDGPADLVVIGLAFLNGDDTVSVTGTAEPEAVINLFSNGALVGTGAADFAGAFTVTSSFPLAAGTYTIAVAQITSTGTSPLVDAGSVTVFEPPVDPIEPPVEPIDPPLPPVVSTKAKTIPAVPTTIPVVKKMTTTLRVLVPTTTAFIPIPMTTEFVRIETTTAVGVPPTTTPIEIRPPIVETTPAPPIETTQPRAVPTTQPPPPVITTLFVCPAIECPAGTGQTFNVETCSCGCFAGDATQCSNGDCASPADRTVSIPASVPCVHVADYSSTVLR
jgi:hypothetical protein